MRSFLRRAARYLQALFKNLYFWGGLALLVLLLFGAYLLFDEVLMPEYTRYGVSVTVPAVTGEPVEQARDELEEQDLRVEDLEETFNPSLPRGVVLEQNPLAGSAVKPGRRVYLKVNTGEEPTVRVPRVVSASVREARNRLQALGLEVEDVREDSVPSPYANTVTRQQPPPGDSLPKGAGVTLWYSEGNQDAPYATVPEVAGLSVGEARQALLEEKLRSVVVRQSETGDGQNGDGQDGAPPGEEALGRLEVTRQSPAPDTRMRQGSEIRLYVGGENVEG